MNPDDDEKAKKTKTEPIKKMIMDRGRTRFEISPPISSSFSYIHSIRKVTLNRFSNIQ
ncbi:hypothetical protein Hanom_Chr17g01545661 [Helianthus anomalus]